MVKKILSLTLVGLLLNLVAFNFVYAKSKAEEGEKITCLLRSAHLYRRELSPFTIDAAISKEKRHLKLVAEYKKNSLEDISKDGRLLLFYQTGIPTRSYNIPLGGGRAKANQPPIYDDMLRVVERERGREVGRIKVEFFPENVQFIPDTQQVFYREPISSKGKDLFKLWNLETGKGKACSEEAVGAFRYTTFVDSQHAFGAVLQKNGGESLSSLMLPDCIQTVISPVDPEYQQGRTWGGLILSPDKRSLAYTIYAGTDVIIWDTANKKSARIRRPSPLFFWDKMAYTSDGKMLIVAAATNALGGENTKSYLLFYDTSTYQQMRRLEVSGVSAIAISPDSRLVAVGFTEETEKIFNTIEQAHIILYDFATGAEVATATHSPIKQQRNDPFAAKISKLAFTPDGKYLLSSTYDTYIWEINSSSS